MVEKFEGTARQLAERIVADINAAGEVKVLYTQFTRFEMVNYLAVAKGDVVGAQVLRISKGEPGELSWEIIDETSAPSYVDANAKLMKLLTPTDNEAAVKWRAACVAKQDEVRARKKIKANKKAVEAERTDGQSVEPQPSITEELADIYDGRPKRAPSPVAAPPNVVKAMLDGVETELDTAPVDNNALANAVDLLIDRGPTWAQLFENYDRRHGDDKEDNEDE